MAKATVDFVAGGEGLRASGSQGPLLSRRAMSDISITNSCLSLESFISSHLQML